MMRVLVTGANGFIGKNLTEALRVKPDVELFLYHKSFPVSLLEEYAKSCQFIYHLAGVNRPESTDEFQEGNVQFLNIMLDLLKKYKNNCPILNASSIQAELDNPYGISKRESEHLLYAYGEETKAVIYNYRLPNVFGKWCRPNYNSVIATFCHNISRDLPIQVRDPRIIVSLVYIDDVVSELLEALEGRVHKNDKGCCYIPEQYEVSLGEIAAMLSDFHDSRRNLEIPYLPENSFCKKLYSTYLSYIPENEFLYPLKMHKDDRGSFTEIFRTPERGQISINVSKPGITKGNHWHHSKNEKFIVVSGKAKIQLRQIHTAETVEFHVDGKRLEVVDIPPGYTHCIINEGKEELVTMIWCNECFQPEWPDTIYDKVSTNDRNE